MTDDELQAIIDAGPGLLASLKARHGERVKDRMMQFFEYSHLPEHLQATSQQFHALAVWVEANLPANPERTVALRKLLEAKDSGIRSMIYKEPG